MNSATFKFRVDGSDYQNIQEKAKKELVYRNQFDFVIENDDKIEAFVRATKMVEELIQSLCLVVWLWCNAIKTVKHVKL